MEDFKLEIINKLIKVVIFITLAFSLTICYITYQSYNYEYEYPSVENNNTNTNGGN